jgi:Tfp pilus assembly protein PilV
MHLYLSCNKGLPAGKAGFSVIEIIIAIFVIVVALGSILNVAVLSLKSSFDAKAVLQAQSYVQEALEAVRNFRDGIAWNSDDPANEYDGLGVVAKGVAYRISKSSDNPARWKLLPGYETLGTFTRSIVFEQGLRDGRTTS